MARQQKTAGRVAFLAHRETIWAELAKGWSVSSVHRQFAAVVPIGLRQFQLYVMRYLVEKTLPRFVSLAEASGGQCFGCRQSGHPSSAACGRAGRTASRLSPNQQAELERHLLKGTIMSFVHIVFQGKGGVGKTLIASFIAQYIVDGKLNEGKVLVLDADPVNASISSFARLGAHLVDLLDGNSLSLGKFEEMIDSVRECDGDVVIDIGPGLFVPLGNHLAEGDALRRLESRGHHVVVRSIVVGGPAQRETLEGLSQTIHSIPSNAQIIVWLNEYFGPITGPEGQPFERMRVYSENIQRYSGIVRLPKRTGETFDVDLRQMLEKRRTFSEELADVTVRIMPRHRLTMMRRQLYQQLDAVLTRIQRAE